MTRHSGPTRDGLDIQSIEDHSETFTHTYLDLETSGQPTSSVRDF